MFIRIKAQSNDFENEYIRDRDIFKKKRKGSKVLFSALLVAAIGGYFYYLNSGNPLPTNRTTIAGTEAKDGAADVNDSGSETRNQFITHAVANDQPQEANSKTPVVELNIEEETLISEENSQDEILTEDLEIKKEEPVENLIADEEINNDIKVDTESTKSITDNDDVIDLDKSLESLLAQDISDTKKEINLDSNQEVSIVKETESNSEYPTLITENPVGLTDQSLTATETSTTTSSLKDIKDSPIKAISTIISNVFAKSSDGKELVADVVEIDFSEINNTKNKDQKIAIVTVTKTEETDYQGSSIEALTQSSTEAINTQAIEVAKVSKFEVTETDVREIIENEKQNNDSTSYSNGNKPLIFDGVDSVSYNQVPAIVDTKQQPVEIQTTETEEEISKSKVKNAIVEVETIEVTKIATEKNKEKDSIKATNNDATTDLAITTTNNESNVSKITIKNLYDQLVTNLDEESTSKTKDIQTNEVASEQITIKQLYKQINANSKTDTTISIAEKTEIVTTEPEGKIAAVELSIDPDKSLAMLDQPDSDVKLDPVAEIVSAAINIKSTTPQTTDQTLEEIEIQTASINANPPTDNKGSTPLMIAALNSELQTVRELVQQGVKINSRNDWGWTALLNATIKGNLELVNYLLKNGASPHLADNDGRSPLMAAVLNKHPQVVKTLLNYNADVNKANRDGWTALSFAAWNGGVKSVRYLLKANAFKQHRTSEGLTPLQLAKQGGHEEVTRLLNL